MSEMTFDENITDENYEINTSDDDVEDEYDEINTSDDDITDEHYEINTSDDVADEHDEINMLDHTVDYVVADTVENKPFEKTESENKHDVRLDFPIEINVQLGTLVVNTDNAMSMEKGDILKFETNCPGEVSLVFQGREVGRGKLVDIEGYLAVQITHNWCHS